MTKSSKQRVERRIEPVPAEATREITAEDRQRFAESIQRMVKGEEAPPSALAAKFVKSIGGAQGEHVALEQTIQRLDDQIRTARENMCRTQGVIAAYADLIADEIREAESGAQDAEDATPPLDAEAAAPIN